MNHERTVGVILAGGVGSRLSPLTEDRAKPAVPFGGNYRIIDFTLSNCYHSGLRRMLVLTQYKSHSLQTHLRDGWTIFNPSIGEYITAIPPQMRTGDSWYEGTADAVYQNLYLLERSNADQVVILSGDHIYRMDYADMVRFHCDSLADATVACMKVPIRDAKEFGVMSVDENERIVNFKEKPENPTSLPSEPDYALASMGIYVFSRQLLCELLVADANDPNSSHDFGKDILPNLIQTHQVFGYQFGANRGRISGGGYWRDVGTIDAYFAANMDLISSRPPLNLHQRDWMIRTAPTQSPPAISVPGPDNGSRCEIENVILGTGSVVSGSTIWNSVLSRDVRVNEGATMKRCVVFDGVQIGSGAKLKNCIIDKHVRIPAGETIGYDRERDAKRFKVSDGGIVVVPKGYSFSSGDESSRTLRSDKPELDLPATTKTGASERTNN